MSSLVSLAFSVACTPRDVRPRRVSARVEVREWGAPCAFGISRRDSHPPPPPTRMVATFAAACRSGRSASPLRGRGHGRGRGGRGGRDGGRRVRDDSGPGRVGWGERLAKSEENTHTADDPRTGPRGEEGAWRHAGATRERVWAQSSTPLPDGEDFRVVNVGRETGSGRVASPIGNSQSTANTESNQLGVRVNKCFKDFTSRRESDKLVQEGRVTVNDAVVTAGARVFPGDIVELDGESIAWEKMNVIDENSFETKNNQFKYVKYWKPKGITCTTDRRDKTNIIDALNYPHARVFPVGRLDKDSTGLILLTNDGRVPNSVLRSGVRKDKKYVVVLDKSISERDLQTLRDGIVISTPVRRDKVDRIVTAKTLPCELEIVNRSDSRNEGLKNRVVQITLREGRNRQIRRMFDALGYSVQELHRMEIMGIGLGGISSGEWTDCDDQEMEILKRGIEAPETMSEIGDDEED